MDIKYLDFLKKNNDISLVDWSKVFDLAFNKNCEVRLELTEVLVNYPNINSDIVLTYLANDSDFLVRASACDSLCCSQSETVLIFLINKAETDANYIVRGYAAMSFGDVLLNCDISNKNKCAYLERLKKSFIRERSRWTKISMAYALCVNNQNEYINYIVNEVNSNSFHLKIAALNTLIQLYCNYSINISKENIDSLRECMRKESNPILQDKYKQLNL